MTQVSLQHHLLPLIDLLEQFLLLADFMMYPLLRVLFFMLDDVAMLDDVVVVLDDALHQLYDLALLRQCWLFSLPLLHFPQNSLVLQSSKLFLDLSHLLALLRLLAELHWSNVGHNWSFLAGGLLVFLADGSIDKFISPSQSQPLLELGLLLVLLFVSFIHDYYL